MAQYQRNFYGTSYYGETNAFTGMYETYEILTDEALNSAFEVNVSAVLPSAIYPYNAPEIKTAGSWTEDASNRCLIGEGPDAKLTFTATCSKVSIRYLGQQTGGTVNVLVTTTVPGQTPKSSSFSFDSSSAGSGEQEYIIDNLDYGKQEVQILVEEAGGSFYFRNIEARVGDVSIESRARTDNGEWSPYSPLDLTIEEESEDNYTILATSPDYAGNNRIQLRIWLATSDNDSSPFVEKITTYSGDINNRTEDGIWSAVIDMESVAAESSKSFSEVTHIDWESTEPDGTSLTIQTRSTNETDLTRWSPLTIPYEKGVRRLRLKEDALYGYIVTPLINPASVNEHLRINQWLDWDSKVELPPVETGTSVHYYFLDERKNINTPLHRILDPRYTAEKGLLNSDLRNKPFYLRIELRRRFDRSSPIVNDIRFNADLIYEENKIIENHPFSSVDEENTGEGIILSMEDLTFNPPNEANNILYYLEDKTERPNDVLLYFDSEKDLPSRRNQTKSAADAVWARVNVDESPNDEESTGVLKHYQYGGGSAVYLYDDEAEIAPSFTPLLSEEKKYRYYLKPGWYNPEDGEVLPDSVNPNVTLSWKNASGLITEKSSHNAILTSSSDLSSDAVVAVVSEDSTWGEVEWVSDEKIYSGSCNVNDIQGDYVREHITPESGDSKDIEDYIVQEGETLADISANFMIEESDLREANNMPVGEEPSEGDSIIIPSRIVLPKINPAAKVGPNPYEIEIVYNSVRQGGRIVPEERITRKNLEIIEEEVIVEKEEVKRGDIANGKDVLRNGKVIEILGIWDLLDDPVAAPSYQEGLDYTLDGNQVDWSSAEINSREPDPGESYYVTYKAMKPIRVKVTIGTDYQEEGGVDRIWRSPEIREFEGTASPGMDHKEKLPPITEWEGTENPEVQDLEYIIEDNDLWVKSWIEESDGEYYAIGSLQDRVPKDNWFPYIHTGYYYLGKDEYYLFSEPITVTPKEGDIPTAENIEYVPGKYLNAAKLQSASKNLVRNSGFEIASEKRTIQRIKFGEVSNLGITN